MGTSVFSQLYELINRKSVIYASLWLKSREEFGEEWEREISLDVSRVFGDTNNARWEEAISGYVAFCLDSLKAQAFFEKNGRYKATSYADCVEQCYRNPEYMQRRYLPGQYLSHHIWPHHQRMFRHYIGEVIPRIKDDVHLFSEVGVGCGMYSQKTLQGMPLARGIGLDISDYALAFTARVIQAHGLSERYQTLNRDIITNPPEEKADFIISQEVLEHLEDPVSFIGGLYSAVRPGGWGYLSAAVNAAHTDHIYLYRSPDEVRKQIESQGWQTVDVHVEENYPEKPKEIRPTIAGFLVKK